MLFWKEMGCSGVDRAVMTPTRREILIFTLYYGSIPKSWYKRGVSAVNIVNPPPHYYEKYLDMWLHCGGHKLNNSFMK